MNDLSDEALTYVLEQYHPLVKHIAKQACYSSHALDINDLYQIGDIAVLRAIKAYDPSSGKNIKSFVANSVRNAIFNEAARFLGIITVDFRTTNQASLVNKLSNGGKTDDEIAIILTEKYGRNFDKDHVRDLRVVYTRRNFDTIQEDLPTKEEFSEQDTTIHDILESVIKDDIDRMILERRILASASADEIASALKITKKAMYEREILLKNRIKRAIEETV
jgi:RNA polymerase sigma factor (sigma-70 family)